MNMGLKHSYDDRKARSPANIGINGIMPSVFCWKGIILTTSIFLRLPPFLMAALAILNANKSDLCTSFYVLFFKHILSMDLVVEHFV